MHDNLISSRRSPTDDVFQLDTLPHTSQSSAPSSARSSAEHEHTTNGTAGGRVTSLDLNMGRSGGDSHKRRSSVLSQDFKQNPSKPRSRKPRRRHAELVEENRDENKPYSGSEDGSDRSSRSTSEEFAQSDGGSDEGYPDEETGLTGKERRQKRRRDKTRNHLDARIAGDMGLAKYENKLADISVVKKLLINAVLIGLWYLFSLSISLYNKWMFSSDHLDFHYPLFTTSLHMLVQFSLASLLLYFIPSLRPRNPATPQFASPTTDSTPKPVVTKFFWVTRLLPCGTATSLDIGLGNMSLKFISLTFYTMCKSSALAFVLLFAFVFRLETPSWKLVLIIASMTVGVIMMVAGETAFNALGFVLIIASAFFSGFRWGLTQILLLRHPATSNPFATLFFLAPIMFTTLFVIASAVEGPRNLVEGLSLLAQEKGIFQGFLLLLFPGVLAFCMTTSEFALLQRTNVVTLSICGIFKEVVTITASGIVFHDVLTPINLSGLVVTIASIAAYNYLKITKMRREARKEVIESEEALAEEEEILAEEEEEEERERERDFAFDTHYGGQGSSAARNASGGPDKRPHDME